MQLSSYLNLMCLAIGLAGPSMLYAQNFCFAQAESYYEQIYCEVKGKGQGRQLPGFNDFKKNKPLTQALLLKRPARQAGIKLVMPVKTSAEQSPSRVTGPSTRLVKATGLAGSCQLKTKLVVCNDRTFRLIGNQNNSRLAVGVLESGNKLGIARFVGDLSNQQQVTGYLSESYRLYIDKMLGIGLGGSTMSYGKFAYIFEDLTRKQVDFAARFETMFEFLKKDKRSIRVSEAVGGGASSLSDCQRLSDEMIVCTGNRVNHIYVGDK